MRQFHRNYLRLVVYFHSPDGVMSLSVCSNALDYFISFHFIYLNQTRGP